MDSGLLLIVSRFAVYATVLVAFGIALFTRQGPPAGVTGVRTLPLPRTLLATLALLGIAASVVQILAIAASMAGVGIGELDWQTLADLRDSAVGYAWMARIGALIVLGLAAFALPGRWVSFATARVASGVAAATLAWTGHGAIDDGALGWLHLGNDILHLLAAGAWVGAIVSLLLLVRPGATLAAGLVALVHDALCRFALTGTILVAVIVATGIVNMWLLVGWSRLLSLGNEEYGRLLLVKFALFGAMLGLAGANRFRLTPALGRAIETDDHAAVLAALRRSLAIELTCAIAILALVAWLGTLSPPAALM